MTTNLGCPANSITSKLIDAKNNHVFVLVGVNQVCRWIETQISQFILRMIGFEEILRAVVSKIKDNYEYYSVYSGHKVLVTGCLYHRLCHYWRDVVWCGEASGVLSNYFGNT